MTIDDPPKRSSGTEHIEQRPPDAMVTEYSAADHARSSDVQALSSPTLGLPIRMLLPLNSAVALSESTAFSLDSHSQIGLRPRELLLRRRIHTRGQQWQMDILECNVLHGVLYP